MALPNLLPSLYQQVAALKQTFALVAVSQLIACSTADIALAAVRAKRVDASFPRPTAVAAQQALVYI